MVHELSDRRSSAVDSVLLIAFGGPDRAGTRSGPSSRSSRAAGASRRSGWRRSRTTTSRCRAAARRCSELTEAQARGLRAGARPARAGAARLRRHAQLAPVPARDAGRRWRRGASRRALGIILSPLRTEASWERYMADVADGAGARRRARPRSSSRRRGSSTRASCGGRRRVARALAEVPATTRAADAAGVHRPQRAGRDGRRLALRGRLHRRGRAPSPPGSATPAGRSPTRAAAAARASRGSSPTSATSLASLGKDGERHVVVVADRLRVRPRRGALRPRRRGPAASPRSTGSRLHRAAAVNDHPRFIAMLPLVRSVVRRERRVIGDAEARRRRRRHRRAGRRPPRGGARARAGDRRSSSRSSRRASGWAARSPPSARTDS